MIYTYTLSSANVGAIRLLAEPGDLFISGLFLLAAGLMVTGLIVRMIDGNANR